METTAWVLLGALGVLIVAGAWVASKRRPAGLSAARAFLRRQGRDATMLPGRLRRLAADPRTPRRARWLLVALALYLVNPIDLIPDFVPILGQLDDVAIAALLLWIAWRAVPPDVWSQHFRDERGNDRSG